MSHIPRARRKGDRGAAAVEFALVFPIFLLLVVATIDFGYYFFVSEIVTNAAREGARAGSVVDPDVANGGGETVAKDKAKEAAEDYLVKGGLTAPGVIITPTVTTESGVPAVQVEVRYPVGSLTGALSSVMQLVGGGEAGPMLANSWAKAVMRWQ